MRRYIVATLPLTPRPAATNMPPLQASAQIQGAPGLGPLFETMLNAQTRSRNFRGKPVKEVPQTYLVFMLKFVQQ